MNQKRQDKMNQVNYILLIALGASLGAAGYFAGKSGNKIATNPVQSDQVQAKTTSTEQIIPNKPNTESPPKPAPTPEAITPEVIAKAKNVPATIKNPQGDYNLVAVVESADDYRRYNHGVQVIDAQRKHLADLTRQLGKASADSVPQRKLIVGQVMEAQKKLEGNLRFMAKHYAYSLKKNYVKVIHEASLLSVTKLKGKAMTEIVHVFKNARDYKGFQQKRDFYLRLKLEQVKAVQAADKGAPSTAVFVDKGSDTFLPIAEQDGNLKPTTEMDKKSKELQQLYNYDPEKNFRINAEKIAIYARAVRLGTPFKPRSSQGKHEAGTPKTSQTNPPKKSPVTSEMIAKAKNVPATIKSPQGVFTLVAVVEGVNSNHRLSNSLRAAAAQRQRLAELSQQFNKTPTKFMQQREMIAGEINETKKVLESNIRIMVKNYAYSVKNKYVQVPHQASLLSVTEKDGEAKAKKIYQFKSSKDYHDFQKKRDFYLRLRVEQYKAAKAAKKTTRNLKPTPEMNEKSKELQQLYQYDPQKTYKVQIQKTALYARPIR